jgi:hypothetical protein
MVELARPIVQHEKGAIAAGSVCFGLDKDLWDINGAGTPTDGTAGDGAGFTGKGARYTDTTNGKLYVNTGTKASPTWQDQNP